MIRSLVVLAALAGCDESVVELGIDAPTDSPAGPRDAPSTCRCRILMCRVPADCAAIGGACGGDQRCVGDFGACTTNAQCVMMGPAGSVCTMSSTSTTPCQ